MISELRIYRKESLPIPDTSGKIGKAVITEDGDNVKTSVGDVQDFVVKTVVTFCDQKYVEDFSDHERQRRCLQDHGRWITILP